jgi:aminoglycoside/choline kinase family phosphotransferase
VPSRPVPEAFLPWALSALGLSDSRPLPELTVVAGDASNRRYFRFELDRQSYVLAEAPPETEKNAAFLSVRELLAGAGVKVPALYASDLERGFLLLEDLGDQLLLPALSAQSVDGYYASAFDVLAHMAAVDTPRSALEDYNRDLLQEELGRFPTWFVQALLGYSPGAAEEALFEAFFAQLTQSALEQPQVLVHRDFHSRNLMLMADDSLAVIDFQDAVVGPVTYDLVSLLRDCYIQWPDQQVDHWALTYRKLLLGRGLLEGTDEAVFLRWFDWMGLQRHIKVLGTFARLYLRDGKSAYLQDLPLVIHYVQVVLDRYATEVPVFGEFRDWFSRDLSPLIVKQHWSGQL